jgi:hypothetical protein
MLQLVHQRDDDEWDDDVVRLPSRRDGRPRQIEHYPHRQRPSVIVRVVRTTSLGLSFASVAFLAYLAGQAGMLDPILAPETLPASVRAPAAAPVAPAAAPVMAQPQPQAVQQPIPGVQGLVVLIRNAVLALHQANVTGDYAVLRGLAAPEFQERNTAAGLSQAFAGLRSAGLDLSVVAAVNPHLYRDAAIDNDGMLRLAGFIPFGDLRADFDLAFEMVGGRWRLFGIGVHPPRDSIATPMPAKAVSPVNVPGDAALVTLVRSSILALNQANLTGDYSVLRDLSATNFQKANSPAKLSDAFANIRSRGLDLAPVAVIEPHLFRPATIDQNGYLRLAGYFPSQPEQVNFDLAFQFESGAWRLFGIGVDTTRDPPQPTASASP